MKQPNKTLKIIAQELQLRFPTVKIQQDTRFCVGKRNRATGHICAISDEAVLEVSLGKDTMIIIDSDGAFYPVIDPVTRGALSLDQAIMVGKMAEVIKLMFSFVELYSTIKTQPKTKTKA
jgi:hypothetical protein